MEEFTVYQPAPAEFEVSDLSVSPLEVEPGEEVFVTVTVTNIGEESGSYIFEAEMDDKVVASDSVTLDGGTSTSVTFKVSSEEEGSHTIEVSGLTGEFTVTEPTKPNNWILIIGMVAVIAVWAVYYWQQKK